MVGLGWDWVGIGFGGSFFKGMCRLVVVFSQVGFLRQVVDQVNK